MAPDLPAPAGKRKAGTFVRLLPQQYQLRGRI